MGIDFQRFGVMPGDGEQRIGFFLPDTFSMLPFISALEPLRAANRISGRHLYSWHLLGERSTPAIASNALQQIVQGGIDTVPAFDRLIVCGPYDPHLYQSVAVIRALKRIARSGTCMGAVDTGSYLLARAGLIGKRRCTLHWENIPGFREEFPQISVSSELFEIDGSLCTCAGGDAALDMMLTLIELDHGNEMALTAADLFIHPGIRRANEPQRAAVTQRMRVFHRGLINCVELMEANLEQPLSIPELAYMAGISRRQLERLFRTHLGTTPTLHYQQLRLRAGLTLLEQTSLSVMEVASACGFSSADHFSRRFRSLFSQSPKEVRKR
jgi:transcriptional regulator GlxA family with amidase domain